jgi:DNA helicase-2/ATP-dependent DNA helicase PcrA
MLDVMREQTTGMTLRDIIEMVLEHSGLLEHYKADREGADRLRTWKNWSTRPRVLSPWRALAATLWPCPLGHLRQSPASQGLRFG